MFSQKEVVSSEFFKEFNEIFIFYYHNVAGDEFSGIVEGHVVELWNGWFWFKN